MDKRKAELADELVDADVTERQEGEAIALLVPTWSIETWLAQHCGRTEVAETEPLKQHPAFRDLWDDGKREATTISKAVEAWRGKLEPTPSLADGYMEAERVWL